MASRKEVSVKFESDHFSGESTAIFTVEVTKKEHELILNSMIELKKMQREFLGIKDSMHEAQAQFLAGTALPHLAKLVQCFTRTERSSISGCDLQVAVDALSNEE